MIKSSTQLLHSIDSLARLGTGGGLQQWSNENNGRSVVGRINAINCASIFFIVGKSK